MSKKSSLSVSILKLSFYSIALISLALNVHFYGRINYLTEISDESYVSELEQTITSHQVKINNYQSNMSDFQGEIGELKGRISYLEQEIQRLSGSLSIEKLKYILVTFEIDCEVEGRNAVEIIITDILTGAEHVKELIDGQCQIELENHKEYSIKIRTFNKVALFQIRLYSRQLSLEENQSAKSVNYNLKRTE